jgi:hypothetical protein
MNLGQLRRRNSLQDNEINCEERSSPCNHRIPYFIP